MFQERWIQIGPAVAGVTLAIHPVVESCEASRGFNGYSDYSGRAFPVFLRIYERRRGVRRIRYIGYFYRCSRRGKGKRLARNRSGDWVGRELNLLLNADERHDEICTRTIARIREIARAFSAFASDLNAETDLGRHVFPIVKIAGA